MTRTKRRTSRRGREAQARTLLLAVFCLIADQWPDLKVKLAPAAAHPPTSLRTRHTNRLPVVVTKPETIYKWDKLNEGAHCLRISSIQVPSAVMNGSQVTLSCHFELQDDQLYSVKWYKNYVEFYRFQPSGEPAGSGGLVSTTTGGQQQALAVGENAKHEFELDGISVNLAKSNETHVHLRQVTLASAATYKCEVSADAPSFATVSLERQLSVYVLPKHKLSIVDNTIQPHQHQQQHELVSSSTSTSADFLASAYNVNDLVNLTCISGSSKPKAKLSWLINDAPVPETSTFLTFHNDTQVTGAGLQSASSPRAELLESQLTLAFRLQPAHLAHAPSVSPQNPSRGSTSGQRYQFVKLRCVAKLNVEFSSETQLLISGGKAQLKGHQQQQQQKQQLDSPIASSWRLSFSPDNFDEPDESADATGSGASRTDHASSGGHASALLWPQSSPRSGALQAGNPEQEFGEPTGSGSRIMSTQRFVQTSQRQVAGPRRLVVWTAKQLRSQAEHIERLMQLIEPNNLDSPLIEAKISRKWPNLAKDDATIETNSPADDESAHATHGSFTNEPNDFDEPEDRVLVNSSSKSLREETSGVRAAWSNVASSSPRGGATSPIGAPGERHTNRDYKLDDVVEFTCTPRFATPSGTSTPEVEQVRPPRHPKRVQIKWFINGREITSRYVNHFDGSDFALLPPKPTGPSSTGNIPSNFRSGTRPQPAAPGGDLEATDSRSSFVGGRHTRLTHEPTTPLPVGRANESAQWNVLLVELSSSILQLKEIYVKCRATVRQPMIEYENQVLIPALTQADGAPGAPQFVQATGSGSGSGSDSPVRRKQSAFVARSNFHQQQQNGNRNQSRSRQLANRQQASGASLEGTKISLLTIILLASVHFAITRVLM